MARPAHWLVRRPLELWALRLWPAAIVALWCVAVATGGVIQPDSRVAFVTGVAAGVASLTHAVWPLDTRARYVALIVNEVALLDRAAAFIFVADVRRHWRVAALGAALWSAVAVAKIVVFLLSAVVVERERARREGTCAC